MTKEELEVRLHHIADAVKELSINKYISDTICLCAYGNECQVFKGIHEMCEILEIKPKRSYMGNAGTNIRVGFDFEGVYFFEICDVKTPIDIDDVELIPKEGEVFNREPQGIFKDMQKVVDDFDKATGNLHADLGTLGVVE